MGPELAKINRIGAGVLSKTDAIIAGARSLPINLKLFAVILIVFILPATTADPAKSQIPTSCEQLDTYLSVQNELKLETDNAVRKAASHTVLECLTGLDGEHQEKTAGQLAYLIDELSIYDFEDSSKYLEKAMSFTGVDGFAELTRANKSRFTFSVAEMRKTLHDSGLHEEILDLKKAWMHDTGKTEFKMDGEAWKLVPSFPKLKKALMDDGSLGAAAMFGVGEFLTGPKLMGSYQTAISEIEICQLRRQAYDLGNFYEIDELCTCYTQGGIGTTNYAMAHKLATEAANRGSAKALNFLGHLYYEGQGVERNFEKAIQNFKLAADSGSSVATYNLFIGLSNQGKTLEMLQLVENLNPKELQESDLLAQIFMKVHLLDDYKKRIESVAPKFTFRRRQAKDLLINNNNFSKVNLLESFDDSMWLQFEKNEILPIIEEMEKHAENNWTFVPDKVDAYHFLSEYYKRGIYGPSNTDKELKYLKLAADLGDPISQVDYSWALYSHRQFGDRIANIETAIEYAQRGIINGSLRVQAVGNNNLGVYLDKIRELRGEDRESKTKKQSIKYYENALKLSLQTDYQHGWAAANLFRNEIYNWGEGNFSVSDASYYRDLAIREGGDAFIFSALENIDNYSSLEDFLLDHRSIEMPGIFRELGWFYAEFGKKGDAYRYFKMCEFYAGKREKFKKDCSMEIEEYVATLSARQIAAYDGLNAELLAEITRQTERGPGPPRNKLGKSVALIFYAEDYDDSLQDLKTPKNDANRLAKILSVDYGYDIKLVPNPKRADILRNLNEQQDLLAEDKLLIFFAGHGKSQGNTSFWLPTDAAADEESLWVRDTTIEDKLSKIPAKNIVVIADTCFSGNLTRGVNIVTMEPSLELFSQYDATISRVAITSGGDQPVLDASGGEHSVFAAAFLSFLENQTKPFPASKVIREIGETVSQNSIAAGLRQIPGYGPLFGQSGHVGPDYMFYPLTEKN